MKLNPPLRDWRGQVVWIVGASSGIGEALAARLHALGAQVVVSARRADALDAFADRHVGSLAVAADATQDASLQAALHGIVARHGRVDVVVYAAGMYQAMSAIEFDLSLAIQHQAVNYVGALNLLGAVLPQLRAQGQGHISLVASVSGYRGLPRALAYGPTKAALINLAETLYLDLHPHGLGVSLVNPGFVDTPMTAPNDFRMPALISAEQAALEIERGWRQGRFEIHFPRRFTLWLKALRAMPDTAYFAAVRRVTGSQR